MSHLINLITYTDSDIKLHHCQPLEEQSILCESRDNTGRQEDKDQSIGSCIYEIIQNITNINLMEVCSSSV